jgi:hypothetical protein
MSTLIHERVEAARGDEPNRDLPDAQWLGRVV